MRQCMHSINYACLRKIQTATIRVDREITCKEIFVQDYIFFVNVHKNDPL